MTHHSFRPLLVLTFFIFGLASFVPASAVTPSISPSSHDREMHQQSDPAHLLKDIGPSENSEIATIVDLNGIVLFAAIEDEASYFRLWRSDGTPQGTYVISNVKLGDRYDSPKIIRSGNRVFFTADDTNDGYRLWKSDGTTEGTVFVRDVFPSNNMIDVDGLLYFTVYNDGLWKSDGTTEGTQRVSDKNDGLEYSLTNVGGTLYFVGGGRHIWESDGTNEGTRLVKRFDDDFEPDNREELFDVNGMLYFTRSNIGGGTPYGKGYQLWRSNGTAEGTVLLLENSFLIGSYGSRIEHLVNLNGRLYFSNGEELWTSDGTPNGTARIASFPGQYTSLVQLVEVGDTLYFGVLSSDNYDDHVGQLWKSDGTTSGTTLIKQFDTSDDDTYLDHFADANGVLMFWAHDGVHGIEPWISDGTPAGTQMLQDVAAGSNGSIAYPWYFEVAGQNVFFSASTLGTGGELWGVSIDALTPNDEEAPPVPRLSNPVDGAMFDPDQPIVLTWDAVEQASSYTALIESSTGDNITIDWQAETFAALGQLPAGSYTWRVKARNDAGESDWSASWQFVIKAQPAISCDTPALFDAIEAANQAPDMTAIELSADCTYRLDVAYSGVGPAANGLPIIETPIVVNGNGATITRDPTAPAFRIATVATSGTLMLHDVTITGGLTGSGTYGSDASGTDAGDGGAIFNSGVLTITDSFVISNTTGYSYAPRSSGNGGGIFNEGTAYIANTVIRDNVTGNLEGDTILRGLAGNGGGIYTSGTLTMTNSVIDNNIAGIGYSIPRYEGSPVDSYEGSPGGSGGGIYITSSARAVIIESSIRGNRAGRGGFGDSGASGGDGGGISTSGVLTITNTTIADNSAGLGGAGGKTERGRGSGGRGGMGGFGGGIYVFGSSPVSIMNSTIVNNSSGQGGNGGNGGFNGVSYNSGGDGGPGGNGGGIALASARAVTITNTTIVRNVTGLGGDGSAVEVVPGIPSGTDGVGGPGGDGGGIYSNSSAAIINTTIAYNTAQIGGQNGDDTISASSGIGSGIHVEDCFDFSCEPTSTTVTFSNSMLVENQVAPDRSDANCSGIQPVDGQGNLSWPDMTCPGIHVDPLLSPISNSGGSTQTLALRTNSPAIDAGNDAACPATDQRGILRPQGPHCDIGAYEFVLPDTFVYLPFVQR